MKKIILVTCALLVATTSIFAAKKTTKGQVRYLNFKPEVASIYKEIDDVY